MRNHLLAGASLLALFAWDPAARAASFDYTGSLDTFTAPVTGSYRILAFGAQGGNGDLGGLGAEIGGEFSLTAGEVLQIAVGGAGGDSDSDSAGGGGGGSFVIGPGNTKLAIAGGGGGDSNGENGGGFGGGGGGGKSSGGGGGGYSGGGGSLTAAAAAAAAPSTPPTTRSARWPVSKWATAVS